MTAQPADEGAVAAYVAAIPAAHRGLFDRIERLINSAAPEATVRISYGIPTYEAGTRRLYLGAWKHGVSLYGWGDGHDGGFVARHPELRKGKGTIQLTVGAAEGLSDDELLTLLRGAIGNVTPSS